jgi:hypothetical protein
MIRSRPNSKNGIMICFVIIVLVILTLVENQKILGKWGFLMRPACKETVLNRNKDRNTENDEVDYQANSEGGFRFQGKNFSEIRTNDMTTEEQPEETTTTSKHFFGRKT